MASTGEAWRLGRRPALDGVRGVAVLAVLAHHTYLLPTYSLGSVGVTMFFTLSGFLITSLLLQELGAEGRLDVRAFYLRRACRLLPALVWFVAVLAALGIVTGDRYFTTSDVGLVLAYVGNWAIIGGHHLGGLHHTWSLAVEEQFYLLWPVAVALLASRGRALFYMAVGSTAASVIAKLALWDRGAGYDRVYYGFDTRADALLIGCLLAMWLVVRREHPADRRRATLALVAVLTIGAVAPLAGPAAVFVLMPTLVALGTAWCIFHSVGSRYTGWLTTRALMVVGQRSYALYLWHYLCLSFAWRLPVPGAVQAMAGIALAWAMTSVSWHVVERPFLRRFAGTRYERDEVAPVRQSASG